MNETEFLDLLRYYFRNANQQDVDEILADYEAHFEEGKKQGLTEEEIAKELGSPKAIYDTYQSEGVVNEKVKGAAQVKENVEQIAKMAQVTAGKAWNEVSPKIPGVLENTAFVTAKLLYAAGIVLAFIMLAVTALVFALMTMGGSPFPGMPPLPGLHPITLISLIFAGLFTAVSVFLIGLEGSKALKMLAEKSPKKGGDEE